MVIDKAAGAAPTPVLLEVGRSWVFASALNWPGWCRRGKGEHAALDELAEYARRYRLAVGPSFVPGPVHVVERVPGDMTTDFGAPNVRGTVDDASLSAAEAARLTVLLEATWSYFDQVIAGAPAELRKGPRGGGRDRDQIAEHLREAERHAGGKVGVRLPPRTAWARQRAEFGDALRAGAPDGAWPARYALRRLAWHVLDHAWEIEERSH